MSTSPSITRPTQVLQRTTQQIHNKQRLSAVAAMTAFAIEITAMTATYPQMPARQVNGSSKPASTPASSMYVSYEQRTRAFTAEHRKKASLTGTKCRKGHSPSDILLQLLVPRRPQTRQWLALARPRMAACVCSQHPCTSHPLQHGQAQRTSLDADMVRHDHWSSRLPSSTERCSCRQCECNHWVL